MLPLFIQTPSDKLTHVGYVIRTMLLLRSPPIIRDRKNQMRTYRRCMVGTEMVDWMMTQNVVRSRHQAVGMWQALLEDGILMHGE